LSKEDIWILGYWDIGILENQLIIINDNDTLKKQ
jgi:hypothetical protein